MHCDSRQVEPLQLRRHLERDLRPHATAFWLRKLPGFRDALDASIDLAVVERTVHGHGLYTAACADRQKHRHRALEQVVIPQPPLVACTHLIARLPADDVANLGGFEGAPAVPISRSDLRRLSWCGDRLGAPGAALLLFVDLDFGSELLTSWRLGRGLCLLDFRLGLTGGEKEPKTARNEKKEQHDEREPRFLLLRRR